MGSVYISLLNIILLAMSYCSMPEGHIAILLANCRLTASVSREMADRFYLLGITPIFILVNCTDAFNRRFYCFNYSIFAMCGSYCAFVYQKHVLSSVLLKLLIHLKYPCNVINIWCCEFFNNTINKWIITENTLPNILSFTLNIFRTFTQKKNIGKSGKSVDKK